jgi:Flp pilus assembly protein protease CpaA
MASYWLLLVFLSWISIQDLRRHEISNLMVMAIVLLGVVLTATGLNGLSWLDSLGGFAVGFLLALVFYCVGGLGGGDVKLLSAMGLVLGWRAELGVIFYVAIFGGFGAAIARWRKRDEFAYGPAIALGLFAYMVHEYLPMVW